MASDEGQQERALADLLGLIYATIDAPVLWAEVLTKLGRAIAAEQTLLLVGSDEGMTNGVVHLCANTSREELLQPFVEHYAGVNVLAAPCDRMFREGTTRYSHRAMADAVFERSEFYQDFFAGLGLFYSMGIKGRLAGGAEVYLSSQRGRGRRGFSETEGRLLPLLLPHLQRALRLRRAMEEQTARAESAEIALEAMDGAVIGLEPGGRVRYCSREAEAMLRQAQVLRLVGGRVAAVRGDHDAELQRCLREVFRLGRAAREEEGLGALTLRDEDGAIVLTMLAVPQTADGVSGGAGAKQAGVAVLLYLQPGGAVRSRAEAMRALYGVTPTEQRVADGLLAGKDVGEIGASLRMTKDATRFHVKRLLAKTGKRRQVELMATMLRLPGVDAASRRT